jgi:hypothetical protein
MIARFAADGYLATAAASLPSQRDLDRAGLPASGLAGIEVDVARLSPAGCWHPVPAAGISGCCAVVGRAIRAGNRITRRQLPLLSGADTCRRCTTRLELDGQAGEYLTVARHLIAAWYWTGAWEAAAAEADWTDCIRWTARTPFGDRLVSDAIAALGDDPSWRPAAAAAAHAWSDLTSRAAAARELARNTAGRPGLREHAAAARAIAGLSDSTYQEAWLLAALACPPGARQLTALHDWAAATRAWASRFCLDADHAAASAALTDVLESIYRDAPVRDIMLLPAPARHTGLEYSSPADWAAEEYRLLRASITSGWAHRLEASLATVIAEDEDAGHAWRLLLITGWPLTAITDTELAYLARYPEAARADARDRDGLTRSTVVLHVPGFAARHATAHLSPHFAATAGPVLPRGTNPQPAQIAELREQAAARNQPARPDTVRNAGNAGA